MSGHAEMSSGLSNPPVVRSAAAERMRAHRERRPAGIEVRRGAVTRTGNRCADPERLAGSRCAQPHRMRSVSPCTPILTAP